MTKPNPLTSLPGPENIHRETLPNGITVLSRANFNSPSVTISGYFQSGSIFESDEKLGLADFVCSMLMRGTKKRDKQKIYDALETVGASFGYDSGVTTSGFSGRALAEDLPLLLDVFSETVQYPAFPTSQVELLRTQLLTGLALRAQDTSDMADLIFDEMIFKGHPYARAEDGWPETIQAITRRDLMDFHKSTIGPKGLVIVVVGAVEPKRAVEYVNRALGDWRNPKQKIRPEIPMQNSPKKTMRRHHKIDGKSQTDLIIGTIGPRRKDPAYLAASLGNSILGQFGIGGRIGETVREKAGLAYYAYSSLSSGVGPGVWDVSAGVNPKNVKRATDLIVNELKRFVEKDVTSGELSDSKQNFIGRLPLRMESNGGVAGALLSMERHDLGLDYYQRYVGLVEKVSRDDVRGAAIKFISPNRLVYVTAGP